jgi:pimeloyl-ACP methyl ester carboxylesterase
MTKSLFAFLTVGALIGAPGAASAQRGAGDPVRADMRVDPRNPPSMDELRIPSHGAGMNGLMYMPGGAGSHGVVIMLHGFPGNERNLDLAQAIRRAGYNVLFFDYRGSWGSGGTFSFENAREDVASALAWVRSPAVVAKYHIDTRRIALIGHSMGGWMAYNAAAVDQGVGCIAALAPWNIGNGAEILAKDPASMKSTEDYAKRVAGSDGPLRTTPADIMRELTGHAKDYNYHSLAPALKNRSMLLVGATHDSPDEGPEMNGKMEHALKAAGATHVKNVTYEDDHPFSAHRVALAELIVRWLANDCTTVWKGK